MRQLLVFVFMSFWMTSISQTADVKLPDFLPPTPDVSSLLKNASLSTTMHTGAANLTIPVYDLKYKDFVFPISLNYASNGFKPDEPPSRVGIGWSLNAGGVVSRTVMGKPDDDAIFLDPNGPIIYDAPTMQWLSAITAPGSMYDTQPDEFSYSVNGISGKFIFKKDGNIVQVPHNNIKIYATMEKGKLPSEFKIVDGKGVQYCFGQWGTFEETLEHRISAADAFNPGNLNKQDIRTAWLLTKIGLPHGGTIDFFYEQRDIEKHNGTTKTLKQNLDGLATCMNYFEPTGFRCPTHLEVLNTTQFVRYKSFFLKRIEINNLEKIDFNYEDRNENYNDNTNDNRLTEISVKNIISGKLIKHFTLVYDTWDNDFSGISFALSEVQEHSTAQIPPNGVIAPPHRTIFDYYRGIKPRPEYTTTSYTPGIDFLGFANANGISSNKVYCQTPPIGQIFLAEQNKLQPNGNVAQNRMLKSVTFPTGGSQTFKYEPNLKTYWDNVPAVQYYKASIEGIGVEGGPKFYNSGVFIPNVDQFAEFYGSVTWLGGTGVPPNMGLDPKTAFFKVIKVATGAVVGGWHIEGYFGAAISVPYTVELHAGVAYQLKLEVRNGEETFAKMAIVYKHNTPPQWKEINIELCGVRVKEIVSYDPVSAKSSSKYFHYRMLTDTLGEKSASAQLMYNPIHVFLQEKPHWCAGLSGGTLNNDQVICPSIVFSINSVATVETNRAGGVVYRYVIESDHPFLSRGCTERRFDCYGGVIGMPVMHGNVPHKPMIMDDVRNGNLLETITFDGQRQVIKRVINHYDYDERVADGQWYNFLVNKRYENDFQYQVPVVENSFRHFDVNQYDIITGWNHLTATETEDFDPITGLIMRSSVLYTYDNVQNVNPSRITETYGNANTQQSEQILKYPSDMPGTPYSTMVNKNILEPIIEEVLTKDQKVLSTVRTEYDLIPSVPGFHPRKVTRQKGTQGVMEDRIYFTDYDSHGNVLSVRKTNDQPILFIWGYQDTRVIAEVQNSDCQKYGAAYTSFELGDRGGWHFDFDDNGIQPAVTGQYRHDLTYHSISYSGVTDPGTNYYVTYWKLTGSGSVEVNENNGELLASKGAWELYRHELTATSTFIVNVKGAGTIDELRFFPKGAFMKTFAYLRGVGVSETCDVNSVFQKYEYDGFNRLVRIRDWENNILKQFDYKLEQPILPCRIPDPDWQPTGEMRCIYHQPNNGPLSIHQEKEEIDLNNCSPTYQTKQWTSTGVQGNCPSTPCLLPSKKWVNGQCETGVPSEVHSEYLGNMTWSCTFHYSWSDGSVSPVQLTNSDSPCDNPFD